MRLRDAGPNSHYLHPALSAFFGLLSGFITALAHPPADLGLIAYISLVPLAIAWRRASNKAFALASLIFGVTYIGSHMWWIRIFGNLAWSALAIEQGVFIAVGLMLARHLLRPIGGSFQVGGFPIAMVAVEFLRAELPVFGITWGGLGYTQHNSEEVLRLASYTGVWGVSFLLVLVNALIAETILQLRAAKARVLFLPAAAVISVALAFLLPVEDPKGPTARLAMIQGNAPEDLFDPHADDVDVVQNHITLTRTLRTSPELVVWPESSVDEDPFAFPQLGEPLFEVIKETGTPFIVGATLTRPDGKFLNTSLFFSPEAELLGKYAKIRLVPFGEFVPMRSLLTPWVDELSRVPRDGVGGRDPVVFSIGKGKFASVICFESTFPGLVRRFVDRGAGLVIVSTNNSSFGRTPASRQHLAFSQARAAEHRIWIAHAALTGISAVVAPSGHIVEQTELFEPAVLAPEVRFSTKRTVYGRFGDWFPILLLIIIVVSGAWGLAHRRLPPSQEAAQ